MMHFCGILAKNAKPHSNYEYIKQTQIEEHPTKYLTSTLQNVKVIKENKLSDWRKLG